MNVDVVHGDRPKHPLVGTVVEPYAILDVIAAGGMGVVFKARHTLTDRVVAMKLLPSELARDESNVERVKIEAKALAQLKHPNIVTTFDFGFTAMQEPFIVMEYVAGESLKEVLDREVLLPVDRALKIFLQAVDGMRYAHSAKILHRDLKPHNIMVSNEPEADHVKILDFGVAKLAEYTQKITRTGEVVGSPLYMSPEQCTGRPTDHRCDIYSIGVMMYETLTGHPPFRGENYISTVHLKCTKLAPSFKDIVPGRVFPERLEMIVLKCLEIEPDRRYSTMAELKADLELVAGVVPRVERAKTNQGLPATPPAQNQNVGASPAKADEIGWQPAWAGGQSSPANPAARSREADFSDSIVTNVSDSTDNQSWRTPSSPNLSDDNWGNTDFSKEQRNQLGWSNPGATDDDNEWIPSTPPSATPQQNAQKPLTQTQGLASLSAALEASSIGAGDMLNIKPGGFKAEGIPPSDEITGDKPVVDLEQTKGPAPIPLNKDDSGDSHFVLTWDQKTGPSWSATTASPQRPKAPMGSMAGTRTRMPGMDANAIANAAVNASKSGAGEQNQQPTQNAQVNGSVPGNREGAPPDQSQNPWGGDDQQTNTGSRFNAAAHGWAPPTSTGSHQAVQGPSGRVNQGMNGAQPQAMNQGMTGAQPQAMNQGMTGAQPQAMNQGMTGAQPQAMNQGMTGAQPQMGENQPRQPHPGFPQPKSGQSSEGPSPHGFPQQDNQGFQLPPNQSGAQRPGFPSPQMAPSNQNVPPQGSNSGFPPGSQANPGFPQAGQGATGAHQSAPGMVPQQNGINSFSNGAPGTAQVNQKPPMPDPWGETVPPDAAVAQMTESETGVKHMAPWQDKTPPVGPVGGPMNQPLFPPSPVAQLAASLMDDQSTKMTTDHSSDAFAPLSGGSSKPIPASVQALMPPPPPSRSQQNMQPPAPPVSVPQNTPPSLSPGSNPATPQNVAPVAPASMRPGMSTPQPGMPTSMQPDGGHSLMGGMDGRLPAQPLPKAPQPPPFEEPQVLGSNEPSPYQGTTAGAAMQKTKPTLRSNTDWHTDSEPVIDEATAAAPAPDSAIKQFAERMKTNMPEPGQHSNTDTGKGFKSYEPVSLAELNAIKTPAPSQTKPTTEGLSTAIPPGHQTTGSAPIYNKKSRTRSNEDNELPAPSSARGSSGARGAGTSMRFNTSRGGTDTKKAVLMTLVAVAIVVVIGIVGFMLLQHTAQNGQQTTAIQESTSETTDTSTPSEVSTSTEPEPSSSSKSVTSSSSSTSASTATKPAQKPQPTPSKKEAAKKPQVAKVTPKKPKKPKAVARTPAAESDTPSIPRRRRAYSTYDSYYSDGN